MLMEVQQRLLRRLQDAAGSRPNRRGVVGTPFGDEFAWVVSERGQMLDEVNAVRAQFGRRPLAVEEVRRVELVARGHADDAAKFALYCAELALDLADRDRRRQRGER